MITDQENQENYLENIDDLLADIPFCCWFVGYFEGEGCFQINNDKRSIKRDGSYRFQATSHISSGFMNWGDRKVLNTIANRIGGHTYIKKSYKITKNHSGIYSFGCWDAASKFVLSRLVRIFDKYPLKSHKKEEFELWKEGVKIIHSYPGASRKNNKELFEIKEKLKEIKNSTLLDFIS